MALVDNDGALVCKKDKLFQIRSMYALHEWSMMSQFTRSVGPEVYNDSYITH